MKLKCLNIELSKGQEMIKKIFSSNNIDQTIIFLVTNITSVFMVFLGLSLLLLIAIYILLSFFPDTNDKLLFVAQIQLCVFELIKFWHENRL